MAPKEPRSAPEPKLTVDRDAALAAWRRQKAADRETQLAYQEVEARRWDKVMTLDPATHGAAHQQKQFANSRDKAKTEAAEMHKLAGTSRAMFKHDVLNTLESMRFGFEQQYLGSIDAKEHPEAYGPQGPYGGNVDPSVWTFAIEALDEVLDEVNAWPDAELPA